mgnify:FL=1
MTYQVFIEEAAVDFIASTRGRKRKMLRTFVHELSSDPFNQGDFTEIDDTGRQTCTKLVDDFAVSYYPDHAVKEIKVFQIAFADG